MQTLILAVLEAADQLYLPLSRWTRLFLGLRRAWIARPENESWWKSLVKTKSFWSACRRKSPITMSQSGLWRIWNAASYSTTSVSTHTILDPKKSSNRSWKRAMLTSVVLLISLSRRIEQLVVISHSTKKEATRAIATQAKVVLGLIAHSRVKPRLWRKRLFTWVNTTSVTDSTPLRFF